MFNLRRKWGEDGVRRLNVPRPRRRLPGPVERGLP